jgi:NRPS condensation-like uncharacterized protein
MIEIKIESKNRKIQSYYNISGYTELNDVAMALLELKKIEQRLLNESENYESIMELKDDVRR